MSSETGKNESFWEPCWACRVAAGEFPDLVVFEDSDVVVAVNPYSIASGHALVMPRSHVVNIYELPEGLAGPILATAARVARAVKAAFKADGITLRQNNDPASDQHLFHFHLHVIPRFHGDAKTFISDPNLRSAEEQRTAAQILREQIRTLS